MTKETEEIKQKIYSTFANTAASLGYSKVHGKIIAALFAMDEPVSLQKLAEETGYSSSSISISLDFLEVLEMISKVKKSGDRKLYIKLDSNLLEALKRAVIFKTKKNIKKSLTDFDEYKEKLEKMNPEENKRTLEKLQTLEKELEKLQKYITMLDEIEIPED
ncbi:MAG: hypothetical protein ABEK36_05380 [Candidatus Aenigmatarchaeota archaeon]